MNADTYRQGGLDALDMVMISVSQLKKKALNKYLTEKDLLTIVETIQTLIKDSKEEE